MTQRNERSELGLGWLGAERVPVLFVSASAEDARAFRALAGAGRSLVVNVPDLAGAQAVIDRLHPALVVCDTEIEGHGSWRNLLEARDGPGAFALVVASRHADEELWAEVINLGGEDVLEKPFAAEAVNRAVGLASRSVREQREAVARHAVLNAARWDRRR